MEYAVQYQRVKVHVQIERRAESLRHGDGARTTVGDALAPGAAAKPAQHSADIHGANVAAQVTIEGRQEAHREWERQHPLTDRRRGRQDAVDEMRGGVGHATTATRRTDTAPLARKGDQGVLAALAAAYAKEAAGENAAVQKSAQLGLDELG